MAKRPAIGLYIEYGAQRQLKDIEQAHHDVLLDLVGEN
jgi:hypothetical protein